MRDVAAYAADHGTHEGEDEDLGDGHGSVVYVVAASASPIVPSMPGTTQSLLRDAVRRARTTHAPRVHARPGMLPKSSRSGTQKNGRSSRLESATRARRAPPRRGVQLRREANEAQFMTTTKMPTAAAADRSAGMRMSARTMVVSKGRARPAVGSLAGRHSRHGMRRIASSYSRIPFASSWTKWFMTTRMFVVRGMLTASMSRAA